ncbi:hypothetical protein SNE40_002018 [Patella caerulea]|uniref:Uncharacterized protein n=1 Tax=Patella caerulea TaxID=87958 RepID=A0AAN8JWP0_PATCE
MFGTTSDKVVSIVTVFILVLVVLTESRKIDCTKFVFAPKCRGVAAKRNNQINFPQISSHRSSKSVPILEDGWDAEDDDTLDFLKGLKFLITRINDKDVEEPTYSSDDDRFWGKLFGSPDQRR